MVRTTGLAHPVPVILRRLHADVLDLAARAGRMAERVLVPNACAFCGGGLPTRRAPVCEGCHGDLPWIRPRFHLEPFAAAIAPLAYAFPVDAAIKRFKFRRKLYYAPAFCHLLTTALDELPDDVDGLLPVPLHWRRQAVRGFNQATEIAAGVGRATGIPLAHGVSRSRHTPYQSGLTGRQRRRNLRRAFRVTGTLGYRHLLIVDDVVTTGETCRELASVLLDAGVERVSVLAIARAEPA